jgi:hypothetical protein
VGAPADRDPGAAPGGPGDRPAHRPGRSLLVPDGRPDGARRTDA